ncbi:WXG100 family type VII secretion target [Nocardia sp. BMG111209]|uniref:WXG100 family type VII secretion target n=1 Tax=Nocardia sp. BMG111209 TaxID=1160137 RepID=UPI00037B6E6F|nr:WXG100 family type VII secretion target [Nocardia sp. BMG111209]
MTVNFDLTESLAACAKWGDAEVATQLDAVFDAGIARVLACPDVDISSSILFESCPSPEPELVGGVVGWVRSTETDHSENQTGSEGEHGMTGQLEANPETLHATAGGLEATAQQLADTIDIHMRAVAAFIGSEWRGVAAGSHEEPWAQWEDSARRVVGSLLTDAAALHSTAESYLTVDTRSAETIAAVSFSLDLPGAL